MKMIKETFLNLQPVEKTTRTRIEGHSLKAISAFVPKEMLIEADITTQISEMTDDALKAEIRRLTRRIEIH